MINGQALSSQLDQKKESLKSAIEISSAYAQTIKQTNVIEKLKDVFFMEETFVDQILRGLGLRYRDIQAKSWFVIVSSCRELSYAIEQCNLINQNPKYKGVIYKPYGGRPFL